MRFNPLAAALAILFVPALHADIIIGPFPTTGEGGSDNGHAFTFGAGGNVFQLDGFFGILGTDLNGGTIGSVGQLSVDALPAGLGYSFSSALSADLSDLTLTYRFENTSAGTFADVQFFSFVDSEIDVPINDYFNEFATVSGAVGAGSTDALPDSFEVDEPGFVFGNIFDNILLGALDNTNTLTTGFPDDVAMALGFRLGGLAPGDIGEISIFLSDDDDALAGLSILHSDSDAGSTDTLRFSGSSSVFASAAVPEPSTYGLLLVGTAVLGFRQRRKKTAKFDIGN